MQNSFTVSGWLINEPFQRYTSGASFFIDFPLLTTVYSRARGESVKHILKFKAFAGKAEAFLRLVQKGQYVTVTGHMESYTVHKKGKARYYPDHVVDDFFIDRQLFVDGQPVIYDVDAMLAELEKQDASENPVESEENDVS